MKTQCTSTKQVARNLVFFALFMIFCFSANTMQAQSNERTVTGVVNSLDGPLLGATVVLKGTATGVMTNEKGEFTFPSALSEDDILVFSYLGYETNEITIKDDTTFVKPFLDDIAIVIVAALRTETISLSSEINEN